jgi:hypothetical protein
LADARSDEFRVLVVANGCTDDTAAVAAGYGPLVRVVSTPIASKSQALALSDGYTQGFPRVYLDADVDMGTGDIRALAGALAEPGVLAAGPARALVMDGRPRGVRWYYDVWQRLPAVQDGLFGRGVIAVSEAGHARLRELPPVLNDDLAASVAFAPHERRVVTGARAVIHPPRTLGDLVRRRVRSLTGLAEMKGRLAGVDATRTSRSSLVRIVRDEPAMAPRMAVFLAVTVYARWKARRPIRDRDFTTWQRDESSRTTSHDHDGSKAP